MPENSQQSFSVTPVFMPSSTGMTHRREPSTVSLPETNRCASSALSAGVRFSRTVWLVPIVVRFQADDVAGIHAHLDFN